MTTGRLRPWTALCILFALVAFAANSVLCRLALGAGRIDAASFSAVRLSSGAAMLLLLAGGFREKGRPESAATWGSGALLFLYAAAFSFAYISLGAGTGALILFGAVQVTMIVAALRLGERPHFSEWAGLILALAGLLVLVFPGLRAPSPAGCALMASAGVAWGFYSLRGRGGEAPLRSTRINFVRSVPFALAVSLLSLPAFRVSSEGILLAVASGALASGVGYVAWYAALRDLSATRAAIVQLSVPVLAAAGGVAFLAERVSLRLVLSGILILGGVALAVWGRAAPGGTRTAA